MCGMFLGVIPTAVSAVLAKYLYSLEDVKFKDWEVPEDAVVQIGPWKCGSPFDFWATLSFVVCCYFLFLLSLFSYRGPLVHTLVVVLDIVDFWTTSVSFVGYIYNPSISLAEAILAVSLLVLDMFLLWVGSVQGQAGLGPPGESHRRVYTVADAMYDGNVVFLSAWFQIRLGDGPFGIVLDYASFFLSFVTLMVKLVQMNAERKQSSYNPV